MIKPVHLPPNSYFDDPAERIERAEFPEGESCLIYSLASAALTFITEWITRGRGRKTNRALRADIVILSINPNVESVVK